LEILMGEEREQEAELRRCADEEALEEIRQLFARYRRIARHGVVREREDAAEEPDAATVAGR
jgi:hypothetical protein